LTKKEKGQVTRNWVRHRQRKNSRERMYGKGSPEKKRKTRPWNQGDMRMGGTTTRPTHERGKKLIRTKTKTIEKNTSRKTGKNQGDGKAGIIFGESRKKLCPGGG